MSAIFACTTGQREASGATEYVRCIYNVVVIIDLTIFLEFMLDVYAT